MFTNAARGFFITGEDDTRVDAAGDF